MTHSSHRHLPLMGSPLPHIRLGSRDFSPWSRWASKDASEILCCGGQDQEISIPSAFFKTRSCLSLWSLPPHGPPRRGPQALMQPWLLWIRPRNFPNHKDVQTLAQLLPNRHKLPQSHPGPPHPHPRLREPSGISTLRRPIATSWWEARPGKRATATPSSPPVTEAGPLMAPTLTSC